jgi:hypothetical protein
LRFGAEQQAVAGADGAVLVGAQFEAFAAWLGFAIAARVGEETWLSWVLPCSLDSLARLRRGVVEQQFVVLAALMLFDLMPDSVLLAGSAPAPLKAGVAWLPLYSTPTITGRSISPSIKSTSTSWPMRGMNWWPQPAPALGMATRSQQEDLSSRLAPILGCRPAAASGTAP